MAVIHEIAYCNKCSELGAEDTSHMCVLQWDDHAGNLPVHCPFSNTDTDAEWRLVREQEQELDGVKEMLQKGDKFVHRRTSD